MRLLGTSAINGHWTPSQKRRDHRSIELTFKRLLANPLVQGVHRRRKVLRTSESGHSSMFPKNGNRFSEKPALGQDPRDHARSINLARDDDSKKSHHALVG